jgi:diacylglycerol kinase family enzyme
MKILIVINPVSGGTSNDKAILRIQEKAAMHGVEVKFLNTNGKNDDEAIQEALKQYKPHRIVAGGGDGTIQLVARNIVQKKIPLAILPLGSANGLATALGFTQNVSDAVDAIFKADKILPLDLLKFNDNHFCIHLGDIGINARMVKEYKKADDRGMMGYAKHLLKAIHESPLLHYTIKTSDRIFEKDGFMLAFANAPKYGTGVHISEGSVSDGKFEICNVEKIALDAAIKAGLTILNVFVDKQMFSDVITCKNADIKISELTPFQIDGEYMGMIDRLSIQIIPSAVPLLVTDAN